MKSKITKQSARRPTLAVLAALTILVVLPTLAGQPQPDRRGEESAVEIPPILNSSHYDTIPTFVSADVAIGPDGELNTDVLDPLSEVVLGNLLDNFERGVYGPDCVKYGEVYIERVNPPDRSSLQSATRSANLILEAVVTGRDYGFYQGRVAGQLLVLEVEQVIRGSAPLDSYYVFYPVGRFEAGPYSFCKVDGRVPEPPEIGERLLLLSPSVAESQEPFLDVRDVHSFIVLDRAGKARLPPDFPEAEAGKLDREDLMAEVENLAREH